jgi:ribosomal-protein-alanine N-acetyltransferase
MRKPPVNISTVGEGQKKPPVLQLGDVRLRPLRTNDGPALLAYLCNPRVIEHTSIPIATPESVAAAVARDMAAYREGLSFRLAVALSDDRLIGVCGFNSWSPVHRHAELAYELAPDYWGRGYMRAAVLMLLRWGFSELNLNRVHAFVMTTNARSIHLLERCGFTREGTLRQYRIARGLPNDFYVFALLAQDFARNEASASPNQTLQPTTGRSDV